MTRRSERRAQKAALERGWHGLRGEGTAGFHGGPNRKNSSHPAKNYWITCHLWAPSMFEKWGGMDNRDRPDSPRLTSLEGPRQDSLKIAGRDPGPHAKSASDP